MDRAKGSVSVKRLRTGILYEITALLVVVMLASGLAIFLLLRRSQDQLIEKSIDKLVEAGATDFTSGFDYVVDELAAKYEEKVDARVMEETFQAYLAKQVSPLQEWISEEASNIVERGFLGVRGLMLLSMPSSWMPRAAVFAADDLDLIYDWEVPDYLLEALEEGKPYLLRRQGIPELGLSDEQLLTFKRVTQNLVIAGTRQSIDFTYLGIIPMHETIRGAESFFSGEKSRSTTLLVIVLATTLLAIILVVFLVLSYLIRKRITQPVEDLSAAAERVSQGDLDVEIVVHQGSDFELLERTFRDMVESFRRYIAASVGEEIRE